MSSQVPKVFCPSCGEPVDIFVMISNGEERIHCSECGLDLSKKVYKQEILNRIIIADDSTIMRKQVAEALINSRISIDLIESENGRAFLSRLSELFKNNLDVDLAILDVNMPIISGIDAARTMRAMETGLKKTKKIPIVFFSVVKCDDNFKKIMNLTKPAAYLNKGNSTDKEQFRKRLIDVIDRIHNV